tara:strand:+ start:718 stop:1764 length:1047 start_codon:yes stop_codon:yes gene_type:complete
MKMTMNRLILLTLISGILGCTKEEFEGPPIDNLYGVFSITDSLVLTNETPDFLNNEEVGFYCQFNKPVAWKIEIQGLISNARKEIIGFSNALDSNTIVWNGNPSQVPFFMQEDCAIQLSFQDEADTLRDTLSILATNSYENGVWFENFEDGLPADAVNYYNTDGGLMTFNVANDNSLLGTSYFKMGGRVNWDWSLGRLDLKIDLPQVPVDAENFYINLGILSDTVDLHTGQFINILISESSAPFNDNTANNGADIFDTDEEVYKLKVPIDWDGWQLKSFNYSDFEPLAANAVGVIFDPNPSNIKGIRIACQACPSTEGNPVCPENFGKEVRTDIDHIIFTTNTGLLEQ